MAIIIYNALVKPQRYIRIMKEISEEREREKG
jgi:hypothetical protein